MQDDKDNFDDFDDFDDVEDFDSLDDDLGDDISYDDDDDLSDFDDVAEDDEGDAVIDESLMAKEKKESIFSKFSFNQLVIAGAVIVGGGFFAFQILTAEPPPRQEQFRSAVNMSGATDNMVFGETIVEDTELQQAETQTSDNNLNKGILNNSASLDSLEIDFDDDVPMPVSISTEGQMDDEDLLMQGVEDEFSQNPNVDIAEEFQTINRTPEMNIPKGFEGDVFGEATPIDQVAPTGLIDNEASITTTLNDGDAPSLIIEDDAEIVPVVPVNMDKPSDNIVAPTANIKTTERVQAQPLNRNRNVVLEDTSKEEITIAEPIAVIPTDTGEKISVLEEKLQKITEEKNKQISQLNKTVEELQKTINEMELQAKVSAQSKETSTVAPKTADVKKPVSLEKPAVKQKATTSKTVSKAKSPSIQWELRAAQPGKAWVSQKGREDLQPVIVGDSLSGIGRITSISYINNQWIVTGQNGSIKQ